MRRCVAYVETGGEIRVRIEKSGVLSGNETEGIHWISLDGVCYSGASNYLNMDHLSIDFDFRGAQAGDPQWHCHNGAHRNLIHLSLMKTSQKKFIDSAEH